MNVVQTEQRGRDSGLITVAADTAHRLALFSDYVGSHKCNIPKKQKKNCANTLLRSRAEPMVGLGQKVVTPSLECRTIKKKESDGNNRKTQKYMNANWKRAGKQIGKRHRKSDNLFGNTKMNMLVSIVERLIQSYWNLIIDIDQKNCLASPNLNPAH